MIRDKHWDGETVLCVGGGPSVTPERVQECKSQGMKVLGANMAFLIPGVEICLIGDERLEKRLEIDQRWQEWPGTKFYMSKFRSMRGWSHHLEDGLCWRSDTGLATINLADILGAKEIVLIGHDLAASGKLSENWHNEYPEDWKTNAAQLYERMAANRYDVLHDCRAPIRMWSPQWMKLKLTY